MKNRDFVVSVSILALLSTAATAAPRTLTLGDMDQITAGADLTASSLQATQLAYQAAIASGDAAALEQARGDHEAAVAALTSSENNDDPVTEPFDKTASDATTDGEASVGVTDTADGSTATGTATASTEGGTAEVFVGVTAEPGQVHAVSKAISRTDLTVGLESWR